MGYRTVTLPAGRKTGVKNARPILHPKIADGLLKLSMLAVTNSDEEVHKAAEYVRKLGIYLTSPQYLKVKGYRLAAKARYLERKEHKDGV